MRNIFFVVARCFQRPGRADAGCARGGQGGCGRRGVFEKNEVHECKESAWNSGRKGRADKADERIEFKGDPYQDGNPKRAHHDLALVLPKDGETGGDARQTCDDNSHRQGC